MWGGGRMMYDNATSNDDDGGGDDVEDDDVEDDEVQEDDVEDDDVEEDEDKDENEDDNAEDEVEEDRSQDLGPHFVRACAGEIQVNMSQEPLYTEIYRKNSAPQSEHPDEAPASTPTIRTLQCGHSVLGKKLVIIHYFEQWK